MNTEQLRAEFEAWMRKEHPDHSLEYVNGWYTHSPPQRLWDAYQAGRASLQSQDREDALMESLQMMVYMVEQSAPQLKGKVYENALAAIDHARRVEREDTK